MKRLYLMRHGHSPSQSAAGVSSDAQRPLSEKGRADARKMAAEIARRGGAPALVLHSPLLRAVRTAEEAASALGIPREPFVPLDNTLPSREVLDALRRRGADAGELLAVGHQPQIGEIACLLTGALFDFRPAGIVAVELGARTRLLWSLNPDDLG